MTLPLSEALDQLRKDRTNDDAWRAMYRGLYPVLISVAYRTSGGRPDLAEEAAHIALIRIARYGRFETIANESALRGYGGRVVVRAVADLLRAQALPDLATRDVTPSDLATELDLETRLDAENLLEVVRTTLSEGEWDLLRALWRGVQLRDIAGQFGIGYGAAAARVHRLRGKIERIIDGFA